ncbi:flagellar biosynthesis anti-sigma factor FlgM [Indiicoccus explosivorum]|uniref:flagellar biosynthesis anti-sigma factor FlgM n=1 Tax=Indiicoccus explosivorum TaxID=1917864 RepID=UPI000B42DF3C|nr:flagellar biosynthesis anti-sigma factor FlgM [Indiicoccus explosivorum]
MKISNAGMNPVNPYTKNQQKIEETAKAAVRQDKLEISAEAKELQLSVNSPERAERIQSLKAQIEAGTYKPDAEKIANGLFDFYKK